VSVAFGDDISESVAIVIAAEAKLLCTVTNTILGAPQITIDARSRS
jgi:hypothetical protein